MERRERPAAIRLIACDIDGTLLEFGQQAVSAENKRAIEEARRAGVVFILATGRHYMTARKRVYELGLGDTPVIASNGTDIRMADRSVHTVDLDDDLVAEIVQDLEARHLPVYLFCGDEILCTARDRRPHLFAAWTEEADGTNPVRIVPTIEALLREAAGRTQKILSDVGEDLLPGTGDEALHQKILGEMQERYSERADVACGGGLNLEINAKGVSKADGLRYVCRMLNIPVASTMAIGDSGNDVDMLRTAGFGVAVSNAMREACEAADVLTDSCAENGVAKAIDGHVLRRT